MILFTQIAIHSSRLKTIALSLSHTLISLYIRHDEKELPE